jgi:hypothetical protein
MASPGSEAVWGLVCGFPEPIRSNRLLLMLKAFIDDSRMGQPPLYVLGGWVAPAQTWAAFSDNWAEILRMSPKVEYFKFYEAMNFRGQFAGMSKQSRNEKLRLLVTAIADHSLLGVSVSIPHHIFNPLFGRHNNPEVSNPYVLAFYALISRLASHYASMGLKEKIEFIFDYQPSGFKSMELAQKGWATLLEHAPQEYRHLLTNHPPSFQDDKQIIPLQAADLHAGWVRAMNDAELLGQPQPEPIWGEVGDRITRIYRHLTEEGAEQIFEEMFGRKPVRWRAKWLPVWRA